MSAPAPAAPAGATSNRTVQERAADIEASRQQVMNSGDQNVNTILLIVLSILLPPLAVWLKLGCDVHVIINVICCCIFWFPGIGHALWITCLR